MSGHTSFERFAPWSVKVGHAQHSCEGVTAKGEGCSRTGHYGYRGSLYCAQHYPGDWMVWYEESRRIQKIAEQAVIAAGAREAIRAEGR